MISTVRQCLLVQEPDLDSAGVKQEISLFLKYLHYLP